MKPIFQICEGSFREKPKSFKKQHKLEKLTFPKAITFCVKNLALLQFPLFKILSFKFVLRVITAKCVRCYAVKYEELICSQLSICSSRVQNCRFSLHCDKVK